MKKVIDGVIYDIFPHRPLSEMQEEYTFYVSTLRSYNGGESRVLRDENPSKKTQLVYTADREIMAEAYEYFIQNLRGNSVYFPLWHLEKFVTLDMVGVSKYFDEWLDPRINSTTVALIMPSGEIFFGPELNNRLGSAHVGGSLVPLEQGYFEGDPQRVIAPTYHQYSFVLCNTKHGLPAAKTYPQLDGNDFAPKHFRRFMGGLEASLVQHQEIHKGDFSYSFQSTEWARPDFVYTLQFIAVNEDEYLDFMGFFMSRCGSYKPFWFPKFEMKLKLIGTGSGSLTIQDKGGVLSRQPYTRIVFFDGENWTATKITGMTNAEGVTTIETMASILPTNIKEVYFLTLCKLGSDSLTVAHLGREVVEFTTSLCEMMEQK